MIKARKRDVARLEDLSRELSRGLDRLMSNDYAIMKRSTMTSTDVFTAPYYQGERYNRITKEIGNELVPMFTAIRELAKLLGPDNCPMLTEPYGEADNIEQFQNRLNNDPRV